MENIVNIVNFIRAVEPRPDHPGIDLFEPVREQMALAKKHNMPVTWLLQYDALIMGPFVDFLKREMPEGHEIGIWFEVVQQNAEAAGIEWRGRWSWDWHTDVGFSVGYTPEERERIADCFVEQFASCFGHKPGVMGSWLFDAHLLDYLHRRHGITTACNCKDQYGTDGYTLWGGYWANAYYPNRRNAYLPAQREQDQIPVPVFRMLGSDPLYQYCAGLTENGQWVTTLEPISRPPDGGGGSNPQWSRWFLTENCREPHFALSYAQAGQENSFGWPTMRDGLIAQFNILDEFRRDGRIRIETLGETGHRFRTAFSTTPVSAVVTLDDWKRQNRAGIWYLCRNGRQNLFREADRTLSIRDWQIFSDDYTEDFLKRRCTTSACTYDALPIMDGMLWHPAIIRFSGGPGEFSGIDRIDDETMEIRWRTDSGRVTQITLKPDGLRIAFDDDSAHLEFRFNPAAAQRHGTGIEFRDGELKYRHRNFPYRLVARSGRIVPVADGFDLLPAGHHLHLVAEPERN